jgi:uncharacterized protein (DUF433 family)
MSFMRITVRPDQLSGTPCIRGLRIPVATVIDLVADGMDEAEILAAYPDLGRGLAGGDSLCRRGGAGA